VSKDRKKNKPDPSVRQALLIALKDYCDSFEDTLSFLVIAKTLVKLGVPVLPIPAKYKKKPK